MKLFCVPLFALATLAAGSAGMADTTAQNNGPLPGEIIYLPQLPSAESLTNSARSQGFEIGSIRQTEGEEVVTYHFAHGPDSVVAYRILPNSVSAGSQAAAPAVVTSPATPPPTVVYTTAPTYYSSYSYPAYYGYSSYPWGWSGLGFGGWYGGWGWGGYGFHGGYGYRGGYAHFGGFSRGGWGGRR